MKWPLPPGPGGRLRRQRGRQPHDGARGVPVRVHGQGGAHLRSVQSELLGVGLRECSPRVIVQQHSRSSAEI
eukprot:8725191-Alexandrium_andersonii.AAC.1